MKREVGSFGLTLNVGFDGGGLLIFYTLKLLIFYDGIIYRRLLMSRRTRLIENSDIYFLKKKKEPDHLFDLIQKQRVKEVTNLDQEDTKKRFRKQLIQKRVDAIMKNAPFCHKVS